MLKIVMVSICVVAKVAGMQHEFQYMKDSRESEKGRELEEIGLPLEGIHTGHSCINKLCIVKKLAQLYNSQFAGKILVHADATLILDNSKCEEVLLEPRAILRLLNKSSIEECVQAKTAILVMDPSCNPGKRFSYTKYKDEGSIYTNFRSTIPTKNPDGHLTVTIS